MKRLTEVEKIKLYDEVYPIALECRKYFIKEDQVIKDTFKTIEQLGILLLRFPAINGDTSLSGFTVRKEPYDCIYVNSRHSLGRQYMSCWHEYYHIYTREGSGMSYLDAEKEDPVEYKANLFASMILMPENLVKQYIEKNNVSPKYLSYETIIKMQNYFGVGYSAMLTRILQLYPQYKSDLKKRYAIAQNTIEQKKRLEDKTKSVNGNLQLINATNDVYIPDSFFEHIQFSLEEKRISKEKAYNLLKIIEGLEHDI